MLIWPLKEKPIYQFAEAVSFDLVPYFMQHFFQGSTLSNWTTSMKQLVQSIVISTHCFHSCDLWIVETRLSNFVTTWPSDLVAVLRENA